MTGTINMPVIGIPEGVKEAGKRVDFKEADFELLIETKGYLLLWQRASKCACAPVVEQTEQPDPNCTLCNGKGWFYFGPSGEQDLSGYQLTDLQSKMLEDQGGSIIRGVVTAIGSNPDPLDRISNWVHGSAYLTVRHENRLGYYDRLTLLDSEIVFSERIRCDGTDTLQTRYPVVTANLIRSKDTVFVQNTHYQVDTGVVKWTAGNEPSSDVWVAIHYYCHPAYLVIVHPHASRLTLTKFKTPTPRTPTGDPKQLPVQALMRYDFLEE